MKAIKWSTRYICIKREQKSSSSLSAREATTIIHTANLHKYKRSTWRSHRPAAKLPKGWGSGQRAVKNSDQPRRQRTRSMQSSRPRAALNIKRDNSLSGEEVKQQCRLCGSIRPKPQSIVFYYPIPTHAQLASTYPVYRTTPGRIQVHLRGSNCVRID